MTTFVMPRPLGDDEVTVADEYAVYESGTDDALTGPMPLAEARAAVEAAYLSGETRVLAIRLA